MNQDKSGKARFRLLQRRGSWPVLSALLGLCLVVSGVLAGSPARAEPMSLLGAAVDIGVVPSSVTVQTGDTFTLEIWVYPHGQEVDVVDADMTFDPDKLEVLSITGDPSALPIELYSAFDNVNGTLTHSRGILVDTPPSTDFRLCSIEFKAKAATDETPLAFTDLTSAFSGGEAVETETTEPIVVIVTPPPPPIPVGGVAYLADLGQILAPGMAMLAVIAGLILGAVVVFRNTHKVV